MAQPNYQRLANGLASVNEEYTRFIKVIINQQSQNLTDAFNRLRQDLYNIHSEINTIHNDINIIRNDMTSLRTKIISRLDVR
jgi:uncharacterized protein YbgA (DUF1722 family)